MNIAVASRADSTKDCMFNSSTEGGKQGQKGKQVGKIKSENPLDILEPWQSQDSIYLLKP